MSDDDSTKTLAYGIDDGKEKGKEDKENTAESEKKDKEKADSDTADTPNTSKTGMIFSPDFNPFQKEFAMAFAQNFFKTATSIDVNPPHHRNLLSGLGDSRRVLMKGKDRSNDEDPSLFSARSNDSTARIDAPRTNVNGEYSRGSGKGRSSSSTITSAAKRQKIDFTRFENSSNVNMNKNGDIISIPTTSDMDEKINALVDTDPDEESSDPSESDESDLDLDNLHKEYIDDEEVGPPIDAKLADLFKSIKPDGLSKEKILEKAKLHPRPGNCNLEVRPVNSEIWSEIMSPKDRAQDLALQKGQKLNTKASYAILGIAHQAIVAKKSKDKKVMKQAFKNIITSATDALAFTLSNNVNSEKLRRELVLKKVAQDQRVIGKDINPDDTNLFGDNLSKRLSDAAGASKLKPRKFQFNQWNSYDIPSTTNSKNKAWSRKNPHDQKKKGYNKKKNRKYQKKEKDSGKKSD